MQQAPHPLVARLQAIPMVLRILVVLAAFGVAMYWCATDSGLYRIFRPGPSASATHNIFYPRSAIYAFGVVLVPAVLALLGLSAVYARRK